MKLLILILMLSASFSAFGKPRLCALRHADAVIGKAERHSDYDKNKHCSVSCMLALRCNHRQVLMIGYLKEFRDLLGKGNAETRDMAANRYGIDTVKHGRARNDRQCLLQCDLRY